jgi:hypothetical protein
MSQTIVLVFHSLIHISVTLDVMVENSKSGKLCLPRVRENQNLEPQRPLRTQRIKSTL